MIAYRLIASQQATSFRRYPKVFWTVMRGARLVGAGNGCGYISRVSGTRIAADFTAPAEITPIRRCDLSGSCHHLVAALKVTE